jgi:hypothetical protein
MHKINSEFLPYLLRLYQPQCSYEVHRGYDIEWPSCMLGFLWKPHCHDKTMSVNLLLPPYRIIGQLRILRQTLTFNFSQQNVRYII